MERGLVVERGCSAWATARCVTTPFDEQALVPSTGWVVQKDAQWAGGACLVASQPGRSLTSRTSVVIRRVGVVATVCPGCGSVDVYIGSARVGTLRLAAAKTVARSLVTLGRFDTARTGVVRLVTRGGPVRLDGVLLSTS